MTTNTNNYSKRAKRPGKRGRVIGCSVAVACLLMGQAWAQMAADRLHGYALQGFATYTVSGGGHTAQPGDSAMDLGMSGAATLAITDPVFFQNLNAATAKDTLSVSMWAQLYEVAAASAFWFYSPSSSSGQRGFQAHTPWSDGVIYFDTSGCCDGALQRINANINTLPTYTDASWWNSWHHFVFVKNGSTKQVWVDGVLFLAGQSTSPLPTDINLLTVGSGILPPANNQSLHGQIDDFAVFGSALSASEVQAIFAGTSATILGNTNLLAYWDFNPRGVIFSAIQAGAGATVTPDISAYYVLANGSSAVQLNSIQLSVNGTNVTSAATILPNAVPALVNGTSAGATLYYASATVFPPASTQMVTLVYSDTAVPPVVSSNTWPVIVGAYNGYALDAKGGRLGFLEGSAAFSPDAGGKSGRAGDRSIDLSAFGSGGAVHAGSGYFLNQGAASNILSFSLWMKLHRTPSGAAVFARSPTSSGGQRGFAALTSTTNYILFDSAGCCDGSLQRVEADITFFPGYVDDSFWTKWHHYVFIYNDSVSKDIWIDGTLLTSGFSALPLPTDFRDLLLGMDPSGNTYEQAWIDDVSIYASPLSPTSISQLTNGVSPLNLASETLLAYWDFNTLSPGPPFISATSVPAPGATNIWPNVGANIQIVNRDTQVQVGSIQVKLNGSDITSLSTIGTTPAGASIQFLNPTLLPALSTNRISVTFSDNATPPNVVSNSWTFKISPYGEYAKDVMKGYLGLFQGNAHFTADRGGRTGNVGDRALDMATDGSGGALVQDPPFLATLNAGAAADKLSVAFWLKQNPIAGTSAFWFNAPSVGGRGFQTHLPWSDDKVYFDSGGLDGARNRINAHINTFPGWQAVGNDTFWTNWHHFAFVKDGSAKTVYIDGQVFLSGTSTAPLATDFNQLLIAYGSGIGSPRGQMDDFSVFTGVLSESKITSLANGSSPVSLGDPNLMAYWNFDNVGPAYIFSRVPAPRATGVAASGPNLSVRATLLDGSTAVNVSSVRLYFNGADVTSQSTMATPVPGTTTLYYLPPFLGSGSSNWVTVVFSDNATPPNVVSNTWYFTAEIYNGITKDVLHNYPGLIIPGAHFTANAGGHSGQSGDYAMDLSTGGGAVHVDDARFLYPAETNNVMAFAFWCKKYDIANSSAFWVNSVAGGGRGFQAHLPYSNNNIYFDTSGCCDVALQRINASITTFPGYVDNGFWTNWHHYVFSYNAGDKKIWIDGTLFLEGMNSAPLAQDFTDMFIGSDLGSGKMRAVLDDFAMFASPVDATNVALLAQGTLPTALAGENLLAYWNFNDVPAGRPTISITLTGKTVVISYTGTLQSSSTANGPFTDVFGAGSPYSATASGARQFYRTRQ